jgi:hypothetical protein
MTDLDRKVAQAMGFKSVNDCEKWSQTMKDPEDEAFEELALKQGQWEHTSGWRKKQIMDQKMKMPPKVPKAFPNVFWREDDGMDLRDYFASDAMKGLLAGLLADGQDVNWESIAVDAYRQADAMMKARVK